MEICFHGAIPKEQDYPDDNEDAHGCDAATGRIVVCDGASESFDAKGWATTLRDAYMQHSSVALDWLPEATAAALSRHDIQSLSWSKRAAWERGSFSTLLAVEWDMQRRLLKLCCVGDSLFLLCREGLPVETIPYTHADQFTQNPQLLATIAAHNSFIEDDDFTSTHFREWQFVEDEEPVLMCMTDAIGAWLLRCMAEGDQNALLRLQALRSENALAELVSAERAAGRMRRDDVTLVVARLSRT